MTKINNLYFEEIQKFFDKNSIKFKSDLEKTTVFDCINTIDNSNYDDLTFFHNPKYLNTTTKESRSPSPCVKCCCGVGG